jgi:hypothetical protein
MQKQSTRHTVVLGKRSGKVTKKVKNTKPKANKKRALSDEPTLKRTTFKTNRELDFLSEKELVYQTGHAVNDWPLVILKELIDNSLDACEESNVSPAIAVIADETGISVGDNGPGLPEATVKAAMDFQIRASAREAYIAPDRGAQGNALKTLLTMPTILDKDAGRLIVEAHGKQHAIRCAADPISQRPIVQDEVQAKTTKGTTIRIQWAHQSRTDGAAAWPFFRGNEEGGSQCAKDIIRLVEAYALFNPHLTITLDWFNTKTKWTATNPGWEKWKPNRPTSPHWYSLQHLARLIAAYIRDDRDNGRDRLVSEFLAEFAGLTGSRLQSKVLRNSGMLRASLSELVVGNQFDEPRIETLLAVMKKCTRPTNPLVLGTIGQEHFKVRLTSMGAKPDSFRYTRKLSPKSKKASGNPTDKARCEDGLPWVTECAFGWLGPETEAGRRIYTGANWSAAIQNPFRSFGSSGEGLEAWLTDLKVGQHEPVVIVVHLVHPRIEYADRGKSSFIIGDPA